MEFAEGKGFPVRIVGEKAADTNDYGRYKMSDLPGNYYEPDFNHLSEVMRSVYENYDQCKIQAIKDSEIIHKDFSWERIGEVGYEQIKDFMNKIKTEKLDEVDPNKIEVTYFDGVKIEITGDLDKEYYVEFLDGDDNIVHTSTITTNMWTSPNRKYYTKWKVRVNGELVSEFNLENKRVLISFESKSIGDTIAWAPYVVDFSKKHNCKVILSTFHNEWFQTLKEYQDVEFINPGQSTKCDTMFKIGWFRGESGKWDRFDLYPNYIQSQPLQKTASDILGLDFEEKNYGINFKPSKNKFNKKYVVLAPESTAGCKEWTYDSWKVLSRLIKKSGYDVVILTNKPYHMEGVKCIHGKSLNHSMNILYHSEFLVSLSSGLAWLNWSLNKHTVMISGFTQKDHEFKSNNTRIQYEHSCNSCWANPNFTFDPGDWDWCPIWKGTDKQHICQKSINPLTVFNLLPL
jgi:autotransporter strand-loop-strand O-heptosyltransferase